MFPRFFRSLGWLRALNVVGAALSLSSLVAVVFGSQLADREGFDRTAMAVLAGTLPFTLVWAWLLRWRALFARPLLTVSVSVGLAVFVDMLVTGLRNAIWFGWERGFISSDIDYAVTHDLVLWGPALLVSWLGLGLPVRRAQRLASQGLAGEENGERFVGSALAGLSALTLVLYRELPREPQVTLVPLHGPEGHGVTVALAAAGLLAGLVTTLLAWQREQRRHAFVRSVEQHEVPGYRVDETSEGKVLVRVATATHDSYRVADADEEMFALDEQGQAVGVRRLDQRR